MKKIASLMVGLLLCGCTAFASEASVPVETKTATIVSMAQEKIAIPQVFDYVYDAGTYTNLNYELGKKALASKFDGWQTGKCSAVAKQLPNGDTIVGRNMDFYITHNPAYIYRTKGGEGLFDTVGLTYIHGVFPTNEEVKANGISKLNRELLPFISTDVLNEKGLYIEVNMRFDELDKNGKPVFACSGTNPKAKERICAVMVPRYLADHCATVSEAVALAKKLDIYTIQSPGMNWNLCMVMADATGNYGLLEIAQNKVVFLKKQPAQANFYVHKPFAKAQHYKAGLGRYDVLMKEIGGVKSEEDMGKLMRKVSYWQCNFPDTCQYDPRSELVQDNSKWSSDYILDPKNAEEVKAKQKAGAEKLASMTREQVMDAGIYWESTFTNVVNCNNKTFKVRFFEDENKVVTLGFDKDVK